MGTTVELEQYSVTLQCHEDNEINTKYDVKPVSISILLGLQMFIAHIWNLLYLPISILPFLCLLPDDPIRARVITCLVLTSAISTIAQALLTKLPLYLTPSPVYLAVISSLPIFSQDWTCETDGDLYSMGQFKRYFEFSNRLQEIRGALLLVSSLQCLLIYTRFIDCLLERIPRNSTVAMLIAVFVSSLNLTPGFHSLRTIGVLFFCFCLIATKAKDITVKLPAARRGCIECVYVKIFLLLPIIIGPLFYWGFEIIFEFSKNLLSLETWYSEDNKEKNIEVLNRILAKEGQYTLFSDIFELPRFSLATTLRFIPAMFINCFISAAYYKTSSTLKRGVSQKRFFTIGIEPIVALVSSILGNPVPVSADPVGLGLAYITQENSKYYPIIGSFIIILLWLTKSFYVLISVPISIIQGALIVCYMGVLGAGLRPKLSKDDTLVVAAAVVLGRCLCLNFDAKFTSIIFIDNLIHLLFSSEVWITGFIAGILTKLNKSS